jgi:hypothetical protein
MIRSQKSRVMLLVAFIFSGRYDRPPPVTSPGTSTFTDPVSFKLSSIFRNLNIRLSFKTDKQFRLLVCPYQRLNSKI